MHKNPKTIRSGVLFLGSEYGKKFAFSKVDERVGKLPAGMAFNTAIVAEDEEEKKFSSFSEAFRSAEVGQSVGIGFKTDGKPSESYGFEKLSGDSAKLVAIAIV